MAPASGQHWAPASGPSWSSSSSKPANRDWRRRLTRPTSTVHTWHTLWVICYILWVESRAESFQFVFCVVGCFVMVMGQTCIQAADPRGRPARCLGSDSAWTEVTGADITQPEGWGCDNIQPGQARVLRLWLLVTSLNHWQWIINVTGYHSLMIGCDGGVWVWGPRVTARHGLAFTDDSVHLLSPMRAPSSLLISYSHAHHSPCSQVCLLPSSFNLRIHCLK